MPQTRVLLLRTAGTNCDRELAHAFSLVGAATTTLHINTLLQNPAQLADFQILAFPGGFSYGDDIASGKILANQLIHHLAAPLRTFVNDGKLVLGICNGFQILVKSGLLPGPLPQLAEGDWHPATLTHNTHGRFEDRWIKLKPLSKKCAWIPATDIANGTRSVSEGESNGLILDLPIAHGEGRFLTRDQAVMDALRANDQIAFEYVNPDGTRATTFPALPNGSQDSIAGICDITGRVLGLMPHPERIVHPENHPLFTRGGGNPDGLILFQTALKYLHAREAVAV